MHITHVPKQVITGGIDLETAQALWRQFCDAPNRKSKESLRSQLKGEAKKLQRDTAGISANFERHFAPLLYAKILLWELHAATCAPQPASAPSSSSGTIEKECKELKALLPTLHACVAFPDGSLSRISLHAAWLYTHITNLLFNKDKKVSAEHAEAIQAIRSMLRKLWDALKEAPEFVAEASPFVKPERELVETNASPDDDDKTFEGLVACCVSDSKIVEQLLRMAVRASLIQSKSKKEAKEGVSQAADAGDTGMSAEGGPAEERPQGNAAKSRDKDSQGLPGKSKGGKSKQQGDSKQQDGEAGSKAKEESELKKCIIESEAKLQQYIAGCNVRARPECSEERLEAFLDVTDMPVTEFRQKYIAAACGPSSVEAKQAADNMLKDARAVANGKVISHFLATGSWIRWSHAFMAQVGLVEDVRAAQMDPKAIFPEEAVCDPDMLLKAIFQHAPIFEPQPESPETPEQQQQQQQQQAAATIATSNGVGHLKGKGQHKAEPKEKALQQQQQQQQLPQQLKSVLHQLLYESMKEEDAVQLYRGGLKDVDQPHLRLILEGKLASWVEKEVQKRRGHAVSEEPLAAQLDRALWNYWVASPGVCEDGNLLRSYSRIWTSIEDKLFAELSYVDSGPFLEPNISMFAQSLLSKDSRLRDKEEELKADQRLWLFGLAALQLEEGLLPLPMDKPLSSFTPLTLLLNQAIGLHSCEVEPRLKFLKMADAFWNKQQYSREAQEVIGLNEGQMRVLIDNRVHKDEEQLRRLPVGGLDFQDASTFDEHESDLPPYPSSHGVSLERDIHSMEDMQIVADGVLQEMCPKWQRQAHKLLRMLLDLKHCSPALLRALSWFLACGGRLTPALRHNMAPPPSIDLKDDEATWEAIGMLPLVELVQLRQFLLQQVGRRAEMVPAFQDNTKNEFDQIFTRTMVIEKKQKPGANTSKGGKGGANSEESAVVRLSRKAYRAFCYDFHCFLATGSLPVDNSKGPLRTSVADLPNNWMDETDTHSLNPIPDIPFAEDGSELAEHAVFDRLLYHKLAPPSQEETDIPDTDQKFAADVQGVSSAACWLVKMKEHTLGLCAALQQAEEHVPKLLQGLKRGWTESEAANENGRVEDCVFSPPPFSPDWGFGLDDEETSKVSSTDCLEGKQAMLKLDAAIAQCQVAYNQAHEQFFQFLASKWDRAYEENRLQQSHQHGVIDDIKAEIDKCQEGGAKSNRASDKDKKGKNDKLAKLTEDLSLQKTTQANLKTNQGKIAEAYQQHSRNQHVWASKSAHANLALKQRLKLDLSGRTHSSLAAMTYANLLPSSSTSSKERIIDVQSTPVCWPELRDSGHKVLQKMLWATVKSELVVDIHGVALWKDLLNLIMTPYPSGALHGPDQWALPILVENLLSKYAEYNQAELLRISEEGASNEVGGAPSKGKDKDQDKKAKEKRKLEAEWQRKQALKLKEEEEEEERQRQASAAAATAGQDSTARKATPTDLSTEDETLLNSQYLEEAAKYSAATPSSSSCFGAFADGGWQSPDLTLPIVPPPPPPPRGRTSRQGQLHGVAGSMHPQPPSPPPPANLSEEEIYRRDMRAAGFDPDDDDARVQYVIEKTSREESGAPAPQPPPPEPNAWDDEAFLQDQAMASGQSTDAFGSPNLSLPHNLGAGFKTDDTARSGGNPGVSSGRGGAAAGGGAGRQASRLGGRQDAGGAAAGGGMGIGSEREGKAGSAGPQASSRIGAQAGPDFGGGASRRGGGGASRGPRSRDLMDSSGAAGVEKGGLHQGFKGQELGRGGSGGASAGRGGSGRESGLGGGGVSKPGTRVPPPPPPPPKPHQVPGAEWDEPGGGAASKKMSKREKDKQRQRQREEQREAQRQSAGHPYSGTSPPSHLPSDHLAIPPPHQPAHPLPKPSQSHRAGPFASQHQQQFAASPTTPPAPLPGAWASAGNEEPQPPTKAAEDEGPVRDPWAPMVTPEDEEVASTLSSTHPAPAYTQHPPFPDHTFAATNINPTVSPQSSMEATGGVLWPPFPAPLHPFHQQHEQQPHYPHASHAPHAPLVGLHGGPPALAAALRAQQGHLSQHPPHLHQQQQQHNAMLGGFPPMHHRQLHMQQQQQSAVPEPEDEEEDKEDDLMALLTGGASEEPPPQQHQQQPPHPSYYSGHFPSYPHQQNPAFFPPHLQGQNMPIPPHEPLGGFPHPHAAQQLPPDDPWGPYADTLHPQQQQQQQQQQDEAGAHPYLQDPYPGAEDGVYLQGTPEAGGHHSTESAFSPGMSGMSGSGSASKANPWDFAGVQGRTPQADNLPDLSPDAFPSLSASAAAPRKGPQGPWAQGPWAKPHMAAHQDVRQEEEEDEELQRVLEASKQDTQLRGGISRQMQHQQGATPEAEEDSMAPSQSVGPGLINRTGEYNCFLNVIIQCLWHLTVFKQKLQREVPRHESYRAQHPVVASLLRLFKELEEGEMRIAADPKAARLLVDPSDLREALDAIPGKNIRMGEMSDPSEVLETLYGCLDAGVYLDQRSIVDETFGLHVNEYVDCGYCGKISHQIGEHTELFHVIHVALLVFSEEGSLGRALQWSASQDVKRCDKDVGGCGAACTPVKRIHVMPQVFSIILAWEGSVDATTIQQAMSKVDTNLRLVEVYGPGPHPVETEGLGSPADVEYKLRSMFCYYGQHYFAFILKPELEQWVMFDDTTVSTIGSWEAVLAKCAKGRIQPCLLFYEQQ